MCAIICDGLSLATAPIWQGWISSTINSQKERWQKGREVILREKSAENKKAEEQSSFVSTYADNIEKNPLLFPE